MVKTVVIILIIVIIIALIGIVYKMLLNRLQTLNIKINEAEKIINEHLKKRYDLVVRTSHLVKKNIDLDIEVFKEVETLKTQKVSNNEFDSKINEAYNIISQLKEDYPELNENRGFKDILEEFLESNEILEAAKQYYDKYATELNSNLTKFPINIIGKIHKITKRDYYNTTDIEEETLIDKENM